MEELAEFVNATAQERGWKEHVPGGLWTLHSTTHTSEDFLRGDILTLPTCVPRLFTDYMDARGDLEDPLANTGADYAYDSVPLAFFKGDEVNERGDLEAAIGLRSPTAMETDPWAAATAPRVATAIF